MHRLVVAALGCCLLAVVSVVRDEIDAVCRWRFDAGCAPVYAVQGTATTKNSMKTPEMTAGQVGSISLYGQIAVYSFPRRMAISFRTCQIVLFREGLT